MSSRYKKILSVMAIATAMAMSASMISAFAANESINDVTNGDIVVTVEDTVLVKDVDYTLEYKDNVNVGTAKVIVHFIGNYSGEAEQTFNIKKKSSGGGGGGGSVKPIQSTTTAAVTDKDGKPVTTTKTEENGKTIITLPSNKELTDDEQYTIVVKDNNGKPVETDVVLRDKNGNEAQGKTDKDGKVVLPQTIQETPTPTIIPTTEPTDYDHDAYIKGYENGKFLPDGNITRAETASMLYGVLETDDKNADLTFSDLDNGAWYIPAIKAMTETGVIKGYADGTFRPDSPITRAEFTAMLMRTYDNVQKCGELPFSDVSVDLWYADYIYSAYKAGYINGYVNGTFRPDSPITRAEAVKIINEVLNRTDFNNETNPFSDVSSTHWAYKHVLEAAIGHNVE